GNGRTSYETPTSGCACERVSGPVRPFAGERACAVHFSSREGVSNAANFCRFFQTHGHTRRRRDGPPPGRTAGKPGNGGTETGAATHGAPAARATPVLPCRTNLMPNAVADLAERLEGEFAGAHVRTLRRKSFNRPGQLYSTPEALLVYLGPFAGQ